MRPASPANPAAPSEAAPPAASPSAPGIPRRRVHPVLLYGAVTAMMLIWTINYLVAKDGFRQIDGLTLASFRVVLAALIMAAIYGLARRHKASRRYGWSDYRHFARLGLLGIAANQICFTVGLALTTVGHSAIIVALGPVNILILARLIGLEHLSWRKAAGVALSFTGVVILALEHGVSLRAATLRGDLITLTGSLAFAGYAVLGKKVAGRYDSLVMNTYSYLAGALIVFPVAVWRGLQLDWRAVGWQGWWAVFYMALGASVIAYLIWYWALRHLAASRLAVFTYLQPVLATLLGIYVLDEPFAIQLIVAAVLVVTGVALTEWKPKQAEDDEDESVEEVVAPAR